MTDKLSPEACAILVRAEKRLFRFGWVQHSFKRGEKCCAVGAICTAAGVNDIEAATRHLPEPAQEVLSAVGRQVPGKAGGRSAIIRFNDRKGTRRADIIALFRAAREQSGCGK